MNPRLLLPAAALAAAPAAPAATRAPTRGPVRRATAPAARKAPAEVAADGTLSTSSGVYRLFVERVIQNASLTLDFAPVAGEARPLEGQQTVYVYLAVVAPNRDQITGIVGLGKTASAATD